MSVYLSLAENYRPKKWEDIVGQDDAVVRLKGLIKSGKVPHGFLFTGPTGTGKTTLAKVLIRYLNCEKQTACGKCESCRQEDNHPDVTELNGGDARGIDDIRNLIQDARYKPSLGRYRFVLADEIQQWTSQAQNCILTPLEKPPQDTIYIFCSMNPENLNTAIPGRCSSFQLNAPEKDDIAKRLKDIAKLEGIKYIDDKIAGLIAESSGGAVRNAVALLEAVIQSVDGSESKDKKDVKNIVEKALRSSSDSVEDDIAIKILISIYKGSYSGLHSSILDSGNYVQLLNKLTYINLFALDSFLSPGSRKVFYTASNKKFMSECKKEIEDFGKNYVPSILLVQEELNQLKMSFGSFLANDRSLFSSKLGLMLHKIRASKKNK